MLGEQKKRLDFAMHCRFVLHTHVCIPITSFARFAVHQETCRFLDHRFFGAVCTMTKRVNSSFVPKKGKARQVMKKPAMVKTKPWQDVPYTPKNALVGPRGLRTDQTKWKCTLSDLLKADNEGIVKLLVRDKLLIDMTSVTCPRCGKGTLSKLTKCQGDRWKEVLITELPCVAQPTSLAPFVCGRMGQLG